jgi:hypothetical protein
VHERIRRVVTAVLSDLHLGSAASVLATPVVRERLVASLDEADQVVFLGDVMALRDAPLENVLELARPLFELLGEALAGRRIVLVPGNHDHTIVARLLEARPPESAPGELAYEWAVDATAAEPLASLARWLRRSDLVVAYPGFRIRADVYATHGHYLDCHMTVPRPESVIAQTIASLAGRLERPQLTSADYEAVLAPMYAFAYSRAQFPDHDGEQSLAPLARIVRRLRTHGWRRMVRDDAWRRPHARLLGGFAAAGALAAVNRLGVGRYEADVSPASIGRAGVRAMAQVVERLKIDARHVVYGHVHRAGPLQGEPDWVAPGGARLINAGSWVYEPALIGPSGPRDPFWPGMAVLVGDRGTPTLRPVLEQAFAPGA